MAENREGGARLSSCVGSPREKEAAEEADKRGGGGAGRGAGCDVQESDDAVWWRRRGIDLNIYWKYDPTLRQPGSVWYACLR
jgi:hypothetical protein